MHQKAFAALLISILTISADISSAFTSAELSAMGYIDVTASPYNADKSGASDSTAAIQSAINAARNAGKACFFPAGTYKISDTLECKVNDTDYPCVLVGSVANPNQRAVLYLDSLSPGYQNAGAPKLVVYFYKGSPGSEQNTTHYNQGITGIDITVGSGNPGAVALRMQGAEGTFIHDMTIDLRQSGHTGIWGPPGSGGSTHKVTILGGKVGVNTRNWSSQTYTGTQPTPVLTGLKLVNQTERAIKTQTRGASVWVGCTIVTHLTGPIIYLQRHHQGEPYDSCLAMIDSQIVYSNSSANNVVFQMWSDGYSRSFCFDNCYVKNAAKVWHADAPCHTTGWTHVRRLGVHVKPQNLSVGGTTRTIREPVYVGGSEYGSDVYYDAENDTAPPWGFEHAHVWPDDFPSFETPGAANVKDYGAVGNGTTDDTAALQAAITSNEVVFFPKGDYTITETLDLRSDSKLLGVHHLFSRIMARETTGKRFGNSPDPNTIGYPMIRTADDPSADTYLSYLGVNTTFPLQDHNPTTMCNYAVEWRAGRDSIVRHVDFHPHRQARFYPEWAAKNWLGMSTAPDCNYPENSVADDQIFPTKYPIVQILGSGGGHWYNSWLHGNHMFREDCRHILVDGTTEPLHFYHLHTQQQESQYHVEVRDAMDVHIYGVKCELKAGVAKFDNCNNVRVYGSGGLGTPDDGQGYDHLYLFKDCTNFVIGCIGEDINTGADNWIGVCYYRWVNATLGTYYGMVEEPVDGGRVEPPVFERPIMYLRGNPGGVVPEPCSGVAAVVLAVLLRRRSVDAALLLPGRRTGERSAATCGSAHSSDAAVPPTLKVTTLRDGLTSTQMML